MSEKTRLGIGGRLIRPILEKTSPFRWMGSKLAVYELTIQEKAECRVERSFPERRKNRRRGGRGHGNRKRRRVIAADPVKRAPRLVPDTRIVRAVYTSSRRDRWAMHRVDQFVKIANAIKKKEPGSLDRKSLRNLLYQAKLRWAAVSAAASREPEEFARQRLRVLLLVKTAGWGALPPPDSAVRIAVAGPSGIVHSDEPPSFPLDKPSRKHQPVVDSHSGAHTFCGECGGCVFRQPRNQCCKLISLTLPARSGPVEYKPRGQYRKGLSLGAQLRAERKATDHVPGAKAKGTPDSGRGFFKKPRGRGYRGNTTSGSRGKGRGMDTPLIRGVTREILSSSNQGSGSASH